MLPNSRPFFRTTTLTKHRLTIINPTPLVQFETFQNVCERGTQSPYFRCGWRTLVLFTHLNHVNIGLYQNPSSRQWFSCSRCGSSSVTGFPTLQENQNSLIHASQSSTTNQRQISTTIFQTPASYCYTIGRHGTREPMEHAPRCRHFLFSHILVFFVIRRRGPSLPTPSITGAPPPRKERPTRQGPQGAPGHCGHHRPDPHGRALRSIFFNSRFKDNGMVMADAQTSNGDYY